MAPSRKGLIARYLTVGDCLENILQLTPLQRRPVEWDGDHTQETIWFRNCTPRFEQAKVSGVSKTPFTGWDLKLQAKQL